MATTYGGHTGVYGAWGVLYGEDFPPPPTVSIPADVQSVPRGTTIRIDIGEDV